ncbi:hypothetical protein [Floridanema aerugineum]|uniref:Uncharacterized protein n=1 Tax=Floridaenema aerugineum BLCC-F46 TaxID=3153654 RepID=A0ABV4XC59_9CYAN
MRSRLSLEVSLRYVLWFTQILHNSQLDWKNYKNLAHKYRTNGSIKSLGIRLRSM